MIRLKYTELEPYYITTELQLMRHMLNINKLVKSSYEYTCFMRYLRADEILLFPIDIKFIINASGLKLIHESSTTTMYGIAKDVSNNLINGALPILCDRSGGTRCIDELKQCMENNHALEQHLVDTMSHCFHFSEEKFSKYVDEYRSCINIHGVATSKMWKVFKEYEKYTNSCCVNIISDILNIKEDLL